jgi:amino acid transporter
MPAPLFLSRQPQAFQQARKSRIFPQPIQVRIHFGKGQQRIFVLTGTAAAANAGPAIVLSFVLSAFGCVFAGLCYAEFASMIPVAGSAYTYGYATLGEIFAWIIGWDLILEYAFGAATVASGWSANLSGLLSDLGVNIPPQWIDTPGTELVKYQNHWTPLATLAGVDTSALPHATATFFPPPGCTTRCRWPAIPGCRSACRAAGF